MPPAVPPPTPVALHDGASSRPNANGQATRELLLRTAERLFAERGIEAVSLREIGLVAGQRNRAAIHYHFGDKQRLVCAIFEFRCETINARREQLLADLAANDRLGDVAALVSVFIEPLAEQVRGDSRYVGFLARLYLDPAQHGLRSMLDPRVSATYRRVQTLLRAVLPHAQDVFENRIELAWDLVVHALATYQVRPGRFALPFEAFVADLVEATTSLLRAGAA